MCAGKRDEGKGKKGKTARDRMESKLGTRSDEE
jgi:hypothetical protein